MKPYKKNMLKENVGIPCDEENLVLYLQKVAQAHNVPFEDWREGDYQVGIKSESVPVVADIKSVVESFALNPRGCVEVGWGYTVVFLDEIMYRDSVDSRLLSMSLPNGTVKLSESQFRSVIENVVRTVLKETSLRVPHKNDNPAPQMPSQPPMGPDPSMGGAPAPGGDPGMGEEPPMDPEAPVAGEDNPVEGSLDSITQRVVDTMGRLSDKDKKTISSYADSLEDASEDAMNGEGGMPDDDPGMGGAPAPQPMQEKFIFTKKQLREINETLPISKEKDAPHTEKTKKSIGKTPFDAPNLNETDIDSYGVSDHIDKGEEKLCEGVNNNPEYTHYLINKTTNKIVFGYDYSDTEQQDRVYYTKLDLQEWGWNPREYKLVGKPFLMKNGIDPDNDANWAQN